MAGSIGSLYSVIGCGSGKNYKRCGLERHSATLGGWAQQRKVCDDLARDIKEFANRGLGRQIDTAWRDFYLTDLPVPHDPTSHEQQIFTPYFHFTGILIGRTPLESVRDPDGKEIVESLLLD